MVVRSFFLHIDIYLGDAVKYWNLSGTQEGKNLLSEQV